MSSVVINGNTSGQITVDVPAVAGTNTVTLPASTGTVALKENFTGSNVSLAASGYQKLPSGLIMQWGFLTANATITFPIAFPSACVSLTFGAYGTESGVPRATSVSASSFVYASSNFSNQDAYWLAIGY